LLGFTLTSEHDDTAANGEGETGRPSQTLYNDNDSVLTLAKPRGPDFITLSMSSDVSFSQADTRASDNTSITSRTSTVTMETVNAIETRLTALTTHMHNSDRKMNKLMDLIINKARGQASLTTFQNCTTDTSSNDEAGEGTAPLSGNVQ
jgi:hypothetical protein